jgi:hypothetical protein
MKEAHASVVADIAAGEIVDMGDVAGVILSDDGKQCECADCRLLQCILSNVASPMSETKL